MQVSSPVMEVDNPIGKLEFCELEGFSPVDQRSSSYQYIFRVHSTQTLLSECLIATYHATKVSDLFRTG